MYECMSGRSFRSMSSWFFSYSYGRRSCVVLTHWVACFSVSHVLVWSVFRLVWVGYIVPSMRTILSLSLQLFEGWFVLYSLLLPYFRWSACVLVGRYHKRSCLSSSLHRSTVLSCQYPVCWLCVLPCPLCISCWTSVSKMTLGCTVNLSFIWLFNLVSLVSFKPGSIASGTYWTGLLGLKTSPVALVLKKSTFCQESNCGPSILQHVAWKVCKLHFPDFHFWMVWHYAEMMGWSNMYCVMCQLVCTS